MNNTLNKSMVELQKAIRNLDVKKEVKYVSTYSPSNHVASVNKAEVYAESLVRKY